jgi:hypothetical protein
MPKHGAGGWKAIDLRQFEMEIIGLLEMGLKNMEVCARSALPTGSTTA